MPKNCVPLVSSSAMIRDLVQRADVVVGAVLIPGANVVDGKITCKAVAEVFGLDYVPVDSLL